MSRLPVPPLLPFIPIARADRLNNDDAVAVVLGWIVFYGGTSIKQNMEELKNNCPHIVVATPGRLLALIRDKAINLKKVKHFVLDECDKMLESLGRRISFMVDVK